MKQKNFVLIFILLCCLCCGKKGPLTLDSPLNVPAIEKTGVLLRGNLLIFEFKFPQKISAQEDFNPANLERITI